MIIEIEGNQSDSLHKITQLAEKYGNSIEQIQGRGPVDTLHVIGDPKDLAQHTEYLETLPGVGRVWRISSSYKNIARRVSSEGQRSVKRESRVVEISVRSAGSEGKNAYSSSDLTRSRPKSRSWKRGRRLRRWPTG